MDSDDEGGDEYDRHDYGECHDMTPVSPTNDCAIVQRLKVVSRVTHLVQQSLESSDRPHDQHLPRTVETAGS